MYCQYLQLGLAFGLEILLLLLQLLVLKHIFDLGTSNFSTSSSLLLGLPSQHSILLFQKSLVFLLPLQSLEPLLLLVVLQWQKAVSSRFCALNHTSFKNMFSRYTCMLHQSTSFTNVPLTSLRKKPTTFCNRYYEFKKEMLNQIPHWLPTRLPTVVISLLCVTDKMLSWNWGVSERESFSSL